MSTATARTLGIRTGLSENAVTAAAAGQLTRHAVLADEKANRAVSAKYQKTKTNHEDTATPDATKQKPDLQTERQINKQASRQVSRQTNR